MTNITSQTINGGNTRSSQPAEAPEPVVTANHQRVASEFKSAFNEAYNDPLLSLDSRADRALFAGAKVIAKHESAELSELRERNSWLEGQREIAIKEKTDAEDVWREADAELERLRSEVERLAHNHRAVTLLLEMEKKNRASDCRICRDGADQRRKIMGQNNKRLRERVKAMEEGLANPTPSMINAFQSAFGNQLHVRCRARNKKKWTAKEEMSAEEAGTRAILKLLTQPAKEVEG